MPFFFFPCRLTPPSDQCFPPSSTSLFCHQYKPTSTSRSQPQRSRAIDQQRDAPDRPAARAAAVPLPTPAQHRRGRQADQRHVQAHTARLLRGQRGAKLRAGVDDKQRGAIATGRHGTLPPRAAAQRRGRLGVAEQARGRSGEFFVPWAQCPPPLPWPGARRQRQRNALPSARVWLRPGRGLDQRAYSRCTALWPPRPDQLSRSVPGAAGCAPGRLVCRAAAAAVPTAPAAAAAVSAAPAATPATPAVPERRGASGTVRGQGGRPDGGC